MRFDPGVIVDNWRLFVEGALLTLQITSIALVGGLALGVVVALVALVPNRLIRALVGVYLAVLRGVPFILLLFLVHFGMPFTGYRLPALVNGVIALTLFASAYYAEIIRGAIVALPRGQYESARAIGMSSVQAMRHVIAPQVVRPIIPPATGMTLTMIKESSVISSITVAELTYQGLIVQGMTFAPFEVFVAVAGLYWLMTFCVARAASWLERRVGTAQATAVSRSALASRYLSFDRTRAA